MIYKDYYSILMVHPKAESFVIDSAYKRLAREYHPDLNNGSDPHKKMIEINEAYEVLSDPARRKEYDEQYGNHSNQPRDEQTNTSSEIPYTASNFSSSEQTIDDLIAKACVLIRGNNYPPAIALLKRAFEINPYDRRTEMMLKDAKRTWGQILLRNQY